MMPDWDKDAAAGKLILERAGLEVFHSPLHLEGGSIHTDGEGCTPRPRPMFPLLRQFPEIFHLHRTRVPCRFCSLNCCLGAHLPAASKASLY